jgi:hypothetical protein
VKRPKAGDRRRGRARLDVVCSFGWKPRALPLAVLVGIGGTEPMATTVLLAVAMDSVVNVRISASLPAKDRRR